MKRLAVAIMAATVAATFVQPANSAGDEQPAHTAAREMAAASYLIGTWSCAHTVGNFSGTYTTTYARALGDRWLKETWDFPAADGNPAVTAESLLGYDEKHQAWVRFFANSLGQHFEVRMADAPNGWSYKYVSFFPRTTPETADPDAMLTAKSDSEYAIDGPTYPQGGVIVTEHHICRKR